MGASSHECDLNKVITVLKPSKWPIFSVFLQNTNFVATNGGLNKLLFWSHFKINNSAWCSLWWKSPSVITIIDRKTDLTFEMRDEISRDNNHYPKLKLFWRSQMKQRLLTEKTRMWIVAVDDYDFGANTEAVPVTDAYGTKSCINVPFASAVTTTTTSAHGTSSPTYSAVGNCFFDRNSHEREPQ